MTEKTERVQLLNLTFPKLTPIPIHNVDLILHYLGASWSDYNLVHILRDNSSDSPMMTTRMASIAQIIMSPCIAFC